jgi:hypothetical protein
MCGAILAFLEVRKRDEITLRQAQSNGTRSTLTVKFATVLEADPPWMKLSGVVAPG